MNMIRIATVHKKGTRIDCFEKNGYIYLPKDRRKAPCFSYGDIRRALSCVMWEFAV